MTISTPGGTPERVPSTVSPDKKPGGTKPPATKSTGPKPSAARPGAGKGATGKGGGRKPVTPVKVSQGRNWGPIAMIAAVLLVAGGIIGYGIFATVEGSRPWTERAAEINGVVDYRAKKDPVIDAREHKPGPLTYTVNPPVGGSHNPIWQNCMGDVYDAPIANEHAVHSLEHGAVWVTYKQGLPADQVKRLAERVQGKDFTFMSPVANLDHNVSLQAWGYQLKVDSVDDERIEEFIKALRINATMEPGAACSNGITATGTAPRDNVGGGMPNAGN